MKTYPSYKPSGTKWIGDIPESWEKKRLKNLTKSINGFSFKSDDFDKEFDIPVIRIGDVGDVIDFDNCVKVKSHFLEDKNDFVVKKDDILIGLTGGTIGKSGKYNYDFPSLLNQRVGLLRNNDLILNGLLYHYVKSEIFIRYIFYNCYGGGQDNISMNDILNMVFPYPPLQEQEKIVNYLDEKTTIINKLISNKKRKVELLKEQRTSLINEVITKGLNPNVKMKDSGVEWIGEIPDNWNIVPLFTISRHTKEKNEDKEKVVLSLSYGKIKVRDVESNFGLLPESFNDYQRIRPGYIVLRLTDLQNDKKSLRVGLSTLNGIITPVYVSLKTNDKMLSDFLFYHLYNSDLKKILYTLGGGLRQTLRFDELKKFPVPLMSIKEQKEIVEYLDKHIKEIDDLVSMEQKKIELLIEYRQSLVSEVITGKIKVV